MASPLYLESFLPTCPAPPQSLQARVPSWVGNSLSGMEKPTMIRERWGSSGPSRKLGDLHRLGVSEGDSGVFSGTTIRPECAPTRERGESGYQFLRSQSSLASWVCLYPIEKSGCISGLLENKNPLGKGLLFLPGKPSHLPTLLLLQVAKWRQRVSQSPQALAGLACSFPGSWRYPFSGQSL